MCIIRVLSQDVIALGRSDNFSYLYYTLFCFFVAKPVTISSDRATDEKAAVVLNQCHVGKAKASSPLVYKTTEEDWLTAAHFGFIHKWRQDLWGEGQSKSGLTQSFHLMYKV
jgi:hypothetical protein